MSDRDGQDPKKLAQDQVDKILAKTHDSLKWSWLVVMGYALYNATEQAYLVVVRTIDGQAGPGTGEAYISVMIFVFVFLPTFIRFFFGDNRYIDDQYSELRRDLRKWTRKDSTKPEHDILVRLSRSRKRRGLDSINLLAHGIIFALLSLAIGRPRLFFVLYAALLLVNCLFLFLTIQLNQMVTTKVRDYPGGSDHDGEIETVSLRSKRDEASGSGSRTTRSFSSSSASPSCTGRTTTSATARCSSTASWRSSS